jgi:hypothetical protein
MNKKELTADIKAACGGEVLATTNQLVKALHMDTRNFLALMEGVDYLSQNGRTRRYHISDVADQIIEKSQRTPAIGKHSW